MYKFWKSRVFWGYEERKVFEYYIHFNEIAYLAMLTWNTCRQNIGWKSFYTFSAVTSDLLHDSNIYFCLFLQKILAGVDDLKQVKVLEMRVDTRDISLGNFGKKILYFLLIILNFPLWCLDWGFTNQQPVKSTVLLKNSWNRISLYLTLLDLHHLVRLGIGLETLAMGWVT